ncbi:MAG: hypothetical protein J5497_05725, partial [Selenomonadaceae bacterium]|nr:hypothetical protein [Selenomonadaceae bacterium]
MKYTFDNVNGAGVGVDGNDVAVFKGNSTNVSVGSAASEDSMIAADIDFNGDATVVSNANDSNVSIKVMEGTTVEVDGEKWEFDNKSSREVSEIVINKDGDVSSVSATKSVRLIAAGGIENPVSVNIDGTVATWNEITGDITSENDATGKFTVAAVSFDKIGARVNNTGAATVKSASGERVAFSTLTAAGVVANDVTIKAVAGSFSSFAVDLDTQSSGIEGIAIDEEDVAVNVAGDKEFEVKVGKVDYAVATSADNITFDVETLEDEDTRYTNDALALVATVASGKDYTVTGGDAEFITNEIARGGKASFGINGATVEIKNSSVTSNFYHISTDDASEGVDVVGYLKMNDEVNVTNDSDGYRVAYYKDEGDFNALDVVTFTANGAKISAYAGIFGTGVDNAVLITANASGTEVPVQGIPGNAVVSVASGATYHFKNSLSKNEVTVGGAEYTEVTLTAGGDVITNPVQGKVSDLIDDTDIPRKNADQAKWSERATVGGSAVNGGVEDTVVSNHASVYSDFYALDKSGVAANTVAGYANQDDTVPTETKQAINIEGETNLGGASHVTISGNSEIGQVPINIQSNENPNVVDVTVDLTASNVPSSIAVGTTGNVSASHDIRLSTAGTQNTPSYGYLGRGATGENKLSATAGSNLLRHDGTNRTSIAGGMNNDTIRGDVNDVVTGGAGADYFYDYTGYATDYQVGEGDVIIASRLASLDEVTAANIRGQGNQIGFGNGEYLLTLGNIDQNEQVHVKVAVMDNDGNVVKGVRDVVLANSNGFVDATAAGDNGALVIANASRDNSLGSGVHVVVGSSGKDAIHVGNYDTVSGAGGNDSIQIDQGALGVVVTMSEGFDSVSGWNFGFDKAAGKTQLITSGLQPRGRMFEDKLLISLEGGATISFEDTKQFANHGQYDVLVNNEKYTAIRNGDANKLNEASLVNPDNLGYAYVNSNDNIADYYLSER